MKTVVVEGATYTKAKDLADKFGYTTDYIGQLCRAGKVEAKLVGRSWYVTEDSLLVHKDSRYRSLREDENTNDFNAISTDNAETQKVLVRPFLSKKTRRLVESVSERSNYLSRLDNFSPIKYESDELELLPKPAAVLKEPFKINVSLGDAEKIRIRSIDPTPKKLAFTEPPEVLLKGKLEIEDIGSKDLPPVKPTKLNVPAPKKPVPAQPKQPLSKAAPAPKPLSFAPASVQNAQPKPAPVHSYRLVLASLLMSLLIASSFIAFSSVIFFDGVSASERLVFNSASLREAILLLQNSL